MLRHFWIVGFWTMVSRILGLTREILLSHVLGTGAIANAFIIAIKLPNFFRRFSAEGALNSAFVPYYTRIHTDQGIGKANLLLSRIFTIMVCALFILVLFGELNMKMLVKITAPGFEGEGFETIVSFARWTFPYILFISIAALLTGATNSIGKFAHGAMSQSILNISVIFVLVHSLYTQLSAVEIGYNLCYSFLIAGVLQHVWMHLACRKSGVHVIWMKKPFNSDTKVVFKRMIPGVIGASVAQLSIFIDTIMASFLSIGAIPFLYYADRLYQLPLSIFGTTIGTVILPPLSRLWASHKIDEALKLQKKYLYFSLFLTCPAAVGLFVLSFPIIHLVYGHGKFNIQDAMNTASALSFFALGLPAHVTCKIFNATFFSKGDTKTPLWISLGSVGLNIILNFMLMPTFEHTGLAMATSISAWFNLLLCVFILRKKQYFILNKSFFPFILKIFMVSFLVYELLFLIKSFFCFPLNFISELIFVTASVLTGILVSLICFYFFKKSC